MIKKLMGLTIIFLGCFLGAAFAAETSGISPVGYWKTIDDVTGKPKSIVQIWKTDHQLLVGRVIKVFPSKTSEAHKLCTECQGNLRNQPIVGMVVLSGLVLSEPKTDTKSKAVQWNSGKILDPENGKTYQCSVRLTENGKKLNVHGFIGLPLFGRSQTWERVDLMSG